MELSAWAEDHARRLLTPLGSRWKHAEAVARAAREVGSGLTPEDAEVLVAAAFLHDIGYAPELAVTGFHPLDGARHLRALGYERLASLVAHHSRARHEAQVRGLGNALGEFDDEKTFVPIAVAYCDLTTGPTGERMTPKQRLADVEARYGKDSPVTVGMRAAWPGLMDDVAKVNALLKQLWVVSEVLGHASVAITKDIYGHLIGSENGRRLKRSRMRCLTPQRQRTTASATKAPERLGPLEE